MENNNWRKTLLSSILVIGSTTLTIFSIVYFSRGHYMLGIIEGVASLGMICAIFLSKKYFQAAGMLGWFGVFVVLTTILFTGGIEGSGIVWWGLLPVINFAIFGLSGGLVTTIFSVVALLSLTLLKSFGYADTFFEGGILRQAAVVVSVIGFIMYYFEKIAGEARNEAFAKSKLLQETNLKVEESLHNLSEEKINQDRIRKAVLNILEDTKQADIDLKKEKEGIEDKVLIRTKELSEEKSKLLASINAFAKGLVMVDTEGKVILSNSRLSQILGGSDEVWDFQKIKNAISGIYDIGSAYKTVLETKKNITAKELQYKDKYIDLHVSPVTNNKTLIGVLITIGDITEEKIVDRSRDEFFSIASHELRTPLTTIRGNTALIQQVYLNKFNDADLTEMVSDIHESAIRLIGIVNDFLNVSRLEMGRMQFKTEDFDIIALAKKTAEEIDDKNDKVDIKILATSPALKVFADEGKTKEVLVNLIGNGVKYTGQGTVEVSFKQEGSKTNVYISDNGKGIAPENQKLLFHKFQQAEDSLLTRDTTKSTGLGLYISKMMLEGMSGKLWLEKSEFGKGSVFAFSLPTSKA